MQDIDIKYAKLLIVDDNEDDATLLKRLLDRAGYQDVTIVNDSRKVAQMHEKRRYDLILLDHNMPFLNGLAVVEQLKTIEKDSYVPVLMVTAHSDRETRLRVLSAGCKDVISKPYDRTEIINRVKNMAEVRLLHNQVREKNRILLEQENDLRTIVENIAEGVIVTDALGVIKTFNNAAEVIFAYAAGEAIGHNIKLILPFAEAASPGMSTGQYLFRLGSRVAAGKGLECEGSRKGGALFPLNIVVTEAMQHDQQVYVAICRDITEEKRAAEVQRAAKDMLEERVKERTAKLIQANDKLINEIKVREQAEKELATARDNAIEASRLKSEFLANVSHEIRTPLNGMLGMLSILNESGLREDLEDNVKTAYKSGEILLNLINELLDFSKVEAGRIDIEHINYSPVEIFRDVLQLFSDQIANKGLRVVEEISDEIPSEVFGDPWRIRQVAINLVGNAIKFTDDGEVKLRVWLEHEGDAHYMLRLEVCDTGIGISRADQERIFESFTQADGSTTRRFGGTGLGLTISKKLIELMGGDIGVTSEPGKGSCFWAVIPQGKVDRKIDTRVSLDGLGKDNHSAEKGHKTYEAVLPKVKNPQGQNNLKVLIVEDNEVNQKVATKMLTKLNCDVDLVTDGGQALAAVKKTAYDIVFMDCLMPGVDGFEGTRRIRQYEQEIKIERRVPIIAMTANARKKDEDKCYAAGMDDFLSKPLSLDTVRKVIAQWVNDEVLLQ